MCGNLVKKF